MKWLTSSGASLTIEPTIAAQAVLGVSTTAAPQRLRGEATAALWLGGAALFFGVWWVLNHAHLHQLNIALLGHVFQAAYRAAAVGQTAEILLLAGLLSAPLVFALELAVLGWRRSSLRQLIFADRASDRSDLVWFLLARLRVAEVFAVVFTLGLAAISGDWVHHAAERLLGITVSLGGLPLAVQVAIYYTVYGFMDYWTHRWKHGRYLWPLHRYHHAAETFCVVTSDRVHPADHWSRLATVALVQAVLGVPIGVVIGVGVVEGVLQYARHSQLDWDFGWVGRYLVQSPAGHRLHHRLGEVTTNCNYGLMPIWDHLFGTWREAPKAAYAIGVDHPYRHGAWTFDDVWRDYRDFWVDVTGDVRLALSRGSKSLSRPPNPPNVPGPGT